MEECEPNLEQRKTHWRTCASTDTITLAHSGQICCCTVEQLWLFIRPLRESLFLACQTSLYLSVIRLLTPGKAYQSLLFPPHYFCFFLIPVLPSAFSFYSSSSYPLLSRFRLFKNFYSYSITVVCLFSPSLHPTPAEPPSLPHVHPPPWFCPCVLYSSSCNPLSSLSPPYSPLAIVRLFLTSMSLVIFCLLFFFCWLCSS